MGNVRPLAAGDALESFSRLVAMDKMVEFERVVWDRGRNSHNDPESAQRDGLAKPLASGQNQMAFLHELLERNLGDGWVYGGTISVRYIHPVYAGDHISPHGRVASIERADGKDVLKLEVWCENQDGTKTAAGTVTAAQPTGTRSWLEAERGA